MPDRPNLLATVVAPMLNANEDELTVVDVCVRDGESVAAGQLLFVVESTKTTSDVLSDEEGFVRNVTARAGEQVKVSATLCIIADRADGDLGGDAATLSNRPDSPTTAATEPSESDVCQRTTVATHPAQELAAKHGVQLADLGLDRIIMSRDVQSALPGNPKPPAPRTSETVVEDIVNVSTLRINDDPGSAPKLVVLGAGSHARAVIELIRISRPEMNIVAAIDDARERRTEIMGVPIVGDSSELAALRKRGVHYAALGVGAVTNPGLRKQLYERLVNHGFELPSLIHPTASVESSVTMGAGNQVFACAVVSTLVALGDNTLINSGCVISHDCQIGSHAHITPGAILAGGVKVGENSTIGMGCTVFLGTTVGANVIIGNGVHVFENVTDGQFVRPRRQAGRAA